MLQNVEDFAKVQMMQAMKKMTQGFTYRSCILNVPKKEKKKQLYKHSRKGRKKNKTVIQYSVFFHTVSIFCYLKKSYSIVSY